MCKFEKKDRNATMAILELSILMGQIKKIHV